VFAYGDAAYFGSPSVLTTSRAPVLAIAATDTGLGYRLLGRDGAVYAYGDAPYSGAPNTISGFTGPVVALG